MFVGFVNDHKKKLKNSCRYICCCSIKNISLQYNFVFEQKRNTFVTRHNLGSIINKTKKNLKTVL